MLTQATGRLHTTTGDVMELLVLVLLQRVLQYKAGSPKVRGVNSSASPISQTLLDGRSAKLPNIIDFFFSEKEARKT